MSVIKIRPHPDQAKVDTAFARALHQAAAKLRKGLPLVGRRKPS
jgi:hypothetical protein